MSSYLQGITQGVIAVRTLVLALAANCVVAHITGLALAEDPPPSRIVVHLNSDVLVPLIERPIEEVQAVDEVILGVRMIGNAYVTGQPKVNVVDDTNDAAFSVTVTGTIHSRTTGRTGPVQIYSRSTTQFTATKRVAFQPGRGFIGEKAEIAARTISRPERIAPNRGGILGRAIERRASVRAAQSREQVSQIVQMKAEEKIGEAFDRLLEARLARVNRLAQQRYLTAALLGNPRYDCRTIGGWLSIAVSPAVGASGDFPPPVTTMPGPHGILGQDEPPIQVWVHEQVLGKRLAMHLRRVDLARQLLSPLIAILQVSAHLDAALWSQLSAESSYDFSMIDGWLVVHHGPCSQNKSAVLAAVRSTTEDSKTASPTPVFLAP
jgi:hypothetical protein